MSAARRIRPNVPALALQRSAAAAALDMSPEHFDKHVKPYLPVVYSGKLRVYPVAALQKWLEQEQIRPGGRRAA